MGMRRMGIEEMKQCGWEGLILYPVTHVLHYFFITDLTGKNPVFTLK